MMTGPVGGIDPHQDQFTVGVVDRNGVEIAHRTLPNSGDGFTAAIDLLSTHGVQSVGVEGSASWGAHVSIALVAAGFDAREVPAQRSAAQRRARRLAKTDVIDAVAAEARSILPRPLSRPEGIRAVVELDGSTRITLGRRAFAEADGNRTRQGTLAPSTVLKTAGPTRHPDASGRQRIGQTLGERAGTG